MLPYLVYLLLELLNALQSLFSSKGEIQQPVNSGRCGVSDRDLRIIGGSEAQLWRQPWYVALVVLNDWDDRRPWEVSCGSVLITAWHIVTAEHCFLDSYGEPTATDPYLAVIGLRNRCDSPAEYKDAVGIEKIYFNPNFDSYYVRNDIAVGKLLRQVTESPACLPSSGLSLSAESIVLGYGVTSASTNDEPCDLLETAVTVFPRDKCIELGVDPFPGELCAAGGNYTRDACYVRTNGNFACKTKTLRFQGDSGGPLLTRYEGLYYLRGIISYGSNCATYDQPGVYTNLEYYTDWIQNIIQTD